MIVEDDSDAAFRRILGIEVAQQPNEFNTAVAILYARRDMTILEIQRRQDGASAESLVFVIAADFGMLAWYGRQIGCGIADGLDSGLLIHRNGDHVGGRLASGSSCILQRHILIYDQDPAHFRVKFRVAPFQVVLDLFRMEWLFRQDSMHGRLGSLRQRRKTGLHGMLADVPCQRVSADIKHPQNCRFCRWDRRWAGARGTRVRRRGTLANVGASGTCAMTDSRAG